MFHQNHLNVRENYLYQNKLQNSFSTKTLHRKLEFIKKELQTKQITILARHLPQEFKTYQWRTKTVFPIVKIPHFRVISETFQSVLLQIKSQMFPYRLSQLRQLPLIKTLYLLKESLIGFERLFDKYGSFYVSSKMVAVNQNNKCKVWLNEEYHSNSFISLESDEKMFLFRVYTMFQKRSNRLKKTSIFFTQIKQCTKFCQALSFIDNYTKENKISIPSTCRLQSKQISKQTKFAHNYDPSLTMNRAPKFLIITNLSSSLKPSTLNELKININKPLNPSHQEKEKDLANIQMKTSGDTATQLNSNQTMSGSNNQFRDQSLKFKKNWKETQFKSEFLIKIFHSQQNTDFGRNCNSNVENEQFSKKTMKMKQENRTESQKINKREADLFSNLDQSHEIRDEQDQEETKNKITSVFEKNCWQRKINCLFSSEEENMKKSIQTGRQKQNTEKSLLKLELLDSFGKNIHQSYIHNQMNNPGREDLNYHPYTSEF